MFDNLAISGLVMVVLVSAAVLWFAYTGRQQD
jgi:hypothetical protein